MNIQEILQQVKEHSAPDVHIKVGKPPIIRLSDGSIYIPDDAPALSENEVQQIALEVAPPDKMLAFKEIYEVDFSYTLDDQARFRVNLYKEKDGLGLAFRLIPNDIPDAAALGVPEIVLNFANVPRGLVLVTGPTGSGKSTTLTTIIDKINCEHSSHIITIEDPIEFVHRSKKSVVTQRELGSHTKSFPHAIKAALRQDPDVVMIGEMRDPETIMAALTLAETGHLVFSTLHTQDAPQSINRIVDSFPQFQQQQIMTQLSLVLKGVVSQTLLPRKDGDSRVCAYEILITNEGVANSIKEGKIHQLYSMIQLGKNEGMRLLDDDLVRLVQEGVVDPEVALSKARDVETVKQNLNL